MTNDSERKKRIAIMAIKENTPKEIERQLLNLIANGYSLNDLKASGYTEYLSS